MSASARPPNVQASETWCGPPRAVTRSPMRRLLGLITLLVPALGHAQPGAVDPLPPGEPPPIEAVQPPSAAPVQSMTDPQVLALARGTRAAAARGDCVGARALGSQIARLDPEFHAAVIKSDPVITSCRPAERKYSIAAAPETEPPFLPAREGTPSLDGGALVGEFLVGGLFTMGGAVGGGLLGLALDENLSLIHISEPTRRTPISYAVFCL